MQIYCLKYGMLSKDKSKLLTFTKADKYEDNFKHKQTKHTWHRGMERHITASNRLAKTSRMYRTRVAKYS
jgi:hypothetical protein